MVRARGRNYGNRANVTVGAMPGACAYVGSIIMRKCGMHACMCAVILRATAMMMMKREGARGRDVYTRRGGHEKWTFRDREVWCVVYVVVVFGFRCGMIIMGLLLWTGFG